MGCLLEEQLGAGARLHIPAGTGGAEGLEGRRETGAVRVERVVVADLGVHVPLGNRGIDGHRDLPGAVRALHGLALSGHELGKCGGRHIGEGGVGVARTPVDANAHGTIGVDLVGEVECGRRRLGGLGDGHLRRRGDGADRERDGEHAAHRCVLEGLIAHASTVGVSVGDLHLVDHVVALVVDRLGDQQLRQLLVERLEVVGLVLAHRRRGGSLERVGGAHGHRGDLGDARIGPRDGVGARRRGVFQPVCRHVRLAGGVLDRVVDLGVRHLLALGVLGRHPEEVVDA